MPPTWKPQKHQLPEEWYGTGADQKGWAFFLASNGLFSGGKVAVKLQECMHSVELSQKNRIPVTWKISGGMSLFMGFFHCYWAFGKLTHDGVAAVLYTDWMEMKWLNSIDGTCCPCEHHQSTVFADAWIFWPQWIETMELQWSPPFNRPSSRFSNPETSRSHLFSLKLCIFCGWDEKPPNQRGNPSNLPYFCIKFECPPKKQGGFCCFPRKASQSYHAWW